MEANVKARGGDEIPKLQFNYIIWQDVLVHKHMAFLIYKDECFGKYFIF
jgi:hypothetical protein